ncbi:hypothetical protein NC651_011669 [Populus alba x Populus x berolinensis]|nr:hypothetical protein NC651_011669 [Populus alba x Populus x berolinensis]
MFKPCCKRWEFQLMNWGESWDICSGICCTQGCISNKVSPHCGSDSHCCWLDWLLLVLGSDSMCPLMSRNHQSSLGHKQHRAMKSTITTALREQPIHSGDGKIQGGSQCLASTGDNIEIVNLSETCFNPAYLVPWFHKSIIRTAKET